MTLLTLAAECWHLQNNVHSTPMTIDSSCLQQTHRPPLLLSVDGIDGRTDTRPLHRPCISYYVGSVNNSRIQRTLDTLTPSVLPVGFCAPSIDAARWWWSEWTYAVVHILTGRSVSGYIGGMAFDEWSRSCLPSRGVGLQFTAALKGTWNAHC